jgi:hypothetical protein
MFFAYENKINLVMQLDRKFRPHHRGGLDFVPIHRRPDGFYLLFKQSGISFIHSTTKVIKFDKKSILKDQKSSFAVTHPTMVSSTIFWFNDQNFDYF